MLLYNEGLRKSLSKTWLRSFGKQISARLISTSIYLYCNRLADD